MNGSYRAATPRRRVSISRDRRRTAFTESLEPRTLLTTTTVGGALINYQPNGGWGNGISAQYSTSGSEGLITSDNSTVKTATITVSGLPAHTMMRVNAGYQWAGAPLYATPGAVDSISVSAAGQTATFTQSASGDTGSLTTPWSANTDSSVAITFDDVSSTSGNGCRCGTSTSIRRACRSAAARRSRRTAIR